jgi:phage baseplate assembly protein W
MATRDFTKTNSINDANKESYSDLDIMFTAHPVSNDVTTKKDADAVKRSVRNILLTNDYERPFKPNFGANLRGKLFELQGIGAKKRIASDIREALNALEPRIRNVQVKIGENNRNNIDVLIQYTIINGLGRDSVDFTVTRVR